MKTADYILKSYLFEGWSDFYTSFFPSFKYGFTLMVISLSGFIAFIELFFGFQYYTFLAFSVGALVELSSGIYASVVVNKQPFSSQKLGRFMLKFILLMIGLFMVNQFGKEWETKNSLLHTLFEWVYAFMFSLGAFEYLTSILENIAVSKGKPKDYYINIVMRKRDDILNIPTNEDK